MHCLRFVNAIILIEILFQSAACACLWDARTLRQEKRGSPSIAALLQQSGPIPAPRKALERDLAALREQPKPSSADWLNNMAGTLMRLGRASDAVALLEPVVAKFPNDYGIHANRGTAYHLVGRYVDAEKEIARDLEINSNAHFGLEKYHLALLQYLIQSPEYHVRHVSHGIVKLGAACGLDDGGCLLPDEEEFSFGN